MKKEGFGALYAGLSAGVLRQITYTSSRLGIFKCDPARRSRAARARRGPARRGGRAEPLRARARCAGSLPPSTSILSEKLKTYNDGKPVPLYQKAAAGAPRRERAGARRPPRSLTADAP